MKKTVMLLLILSVISPTVLSCADGGQQPGSEETTEAQTINEETQPETSEITTTTAEPTTTTEPPVINYEIIQRYTFDNPDSIGWRVSNQIKDLRIEDGVLKMTSTGGDPNITASAPLNIDAGEIDVIRIKVKNMSENDNCQFFFDTDIEGGLSEDKSYKDMYWNTESDPESGDGWEEVLIYTDDCDLWEGTVKTIRFDPLQDEGDIFIEYISFEKILKE